MTIILILKLMLIFQILCPPLIVVSLLPTVTGFCVKMSCSLEDIKNLLAGQTEALTQVRNHERAEDIQKISEMIDISVQKQITNVIDPIVKRQDNFEAQTNSQYAAIAKEFAYLKQSLANAEPTPSQNLSHNPAPENTPLGNTNTHTTPGSVLPLWDIVEKAERTVGFQPISRVILTKSAEFTILMIRNML